MEERKNIGTEQQNAQQPSEKETKKEPEFALTENGELVINDEDEKIVVNAYGDRLNWESSETDEQQEEKEQIEEEQQEKETKEKQEEKREEEVKEKDKEDIVQPEGEYYTKEEIEKIGIDKLDPNKIPPELVPFYKSMQADYTRKTQKLAEERKKLEEAKAEIERQIRLIEMQTQTNLPLETLKQLMNEAKNEVKSVLGEDNFDEFDPDVQAIIQSRMNEKVALYRQQQIAQQKLQVAEDYLRLNDPLYPQVETVFRHIVQNELPLKQIENLRAAQQIGDPTPFLELYRIARERVLTIMEQQEKQQSQGQATGQIQQQEAGLSDSKPQPQRQSQTKEPPQVETAGGNNPQSSNKRITARDFAGRSIDEQIQLLLKMGIVP